MFGVNSAPGAAWLNCPYSFRCSSMAKVFISWWDQSQGSIWLHSGRSWRSWDTSRHRSKGHGTSVVYVPFIAIWPVLYFLLSHIRGDSLPLNPSCCRCMSSSLCLRSSCLSFGCFHFCTSWLCSSSSEVLLDASLAWQQPPSPSPVSHKLPWCSPLGPAAVSPFQWHIHTQRSQPGQIYVAAPTPCEMDSSL